MDVQEKLKEIIAEMATRGVDIAKINDQTVLTSDLGFDSVQIVQLIVELESQFEFEFEDEDLDIAKLTVYRNLYKIINSKIQAKRL